MATTPEKSRRRPGRPTRHEEMRWSLAELGVDPASFDPRRVLAGIAADVNAPATARVRAALALLRPTSKPAVRPSKRVQAARAAARAGGKAWGDDLQPDDGAWTSYEP